MEVRTLTAMDIVQILGNPKFESNRFFKFEKGLWVQFLMKNLSNKNMLIVGNVQDGELQNFSVTIHKEGVVALFYMCDEVIDNPDYKKIIFEWSKGFTMTGNIKNMKTWDGV